MKELERNTRINRILDTVEFRACYGYIESCEDTRIFCKHDMVHYMDVARLAYIEALRWDYCISPEIIYATAILHDIGRHLEYSGDTPHEEAGAEIAEPILQECGYSADEIEQIIQAIRDHRNPEVAGQPTLSGIIYDADKASRLCFACDAKDVCHKAEEKKRLEL